MFYLIAVCSLCLQLDSVRSSTSMATSWDQRAGRGPTQEIFPVNTWYIWGNSSRLVLLIKRPTRVMYCSGFIKRCVGTSWGVHIFMLRNFRIIKYVISPFFFFPTRFCLKRTGPGSSILIAIVIISIGIAKNTIATPDITISIILFKKHLYIPTSPWTPTRVKRSPVPGQIALCTPDTRQTQLSG